ncbi:probable DNA polymerase epsilon catalytic subunit A [Saccharomycodes ludwigii]|uniref:DNA polymerase epsilon catalytic subunit n=1 Tax=Saccharomycodes ludwigii TaxID=36035 RepID=A0A376B2C9_9ASCO|nr:probable DNA polymerase epsilon catalytic subunit A [Saccharomycodes ludwigii]
MSKNVYSRSNNSLNFSYSIAAQQNIQAAKIDEIDSKMGFDRFIPSEVDISEEKIGWLVNMHPTTIPNTNTTSSAFHTGVSAVDFYFLDEEGGYFKTTIKYPPYFLVMVQDEHKVTDVEEYLKKLLENSLKNSEIVYKDDLQQPNHLLGLKRSLIKLNFSNMNSLFEARKLLKPILKENEDKKNQSIRSKHNNNNYYREDIKSLISDIREYDVPYHVRVSIDKNIRVGKWYKVTKDGLEECTERISFADPVVMAFDIETSKAPLKFPDSEIDQIMMISYMIDGEGYLITNREIISTDIEDFEYTPKPEYVGNFTIFNEPDEYNLLKKFFEHIKDVRPTVIATFNGDFFDWPYVDNRAKFHGISMFDEIGFGPDIEGEYKSSYCSHMDCFRWVKRDSYLPQGSQGLKAVTKAKLGYNPIELDPELMLPYAYEKPQQLSEYSVSDAVATYYLYMKYVHPFIFSLCTIIPLNPDEVLRKGTGTLCEMLLMVQAYDSGILLPNKHTDPIERFYDGHLLETETYVGGHVESLEAGVFRSDLPNDFVIDPTAIDELLEDLPNALKFSIEVECKANIDDVVNFEEIKLEISKKLMDFKTTCKRSEFPLIYHVDVASMYPNIMTSNRLQPDSMKSERDCASCDFNRPGKTCDRRLNWAWRGDFFPAKMDEYGMVKRALQNETFPNKNKKSPKKYLTFDELSYADQVAHIKKRLTDYCRNVYHKVKTTETVEREAIICQRENPFYVNTVRSFRDRRYDYKGRAKEWKKKLASIPSTEKHARDEAKKMVVLNDSLQLAHKVILNSFYGYVMRKGSRWYSMEMAGITCLTGATIIQMARALVERLGRPLELDTDGIWCILPKSFPENFQFKLKNGKKLFMSYPCSMLNYKVHAKFTNHQYQTLVDASKYKYETHSDNSIFFEVDGPYKAMILPTSKEEGKGIKKRYAVFNTDGSLAELKGFELKRRGELQLIKNFQKDIFKTFLEGSTLEECYQVVAKIADRWLDILVNKGAMLEDEDLIDLICENRSMSKTLKEYEGQKSTSITTAKRLGDFLGGDMVKDKGLQCKYIISKKPFNAPVTERAVPVAIFSADLNVKRTYLKKWLMDSSLNDFDPRAIIDWEYYKERLGSTIQKIITIPAALQNVENPVPRVVHPDWLKKRLAVKADKFKQVSLTKFFKKTNEYVRIRDIEDCFSSTNHLTTVATNPKVSRVITRNKRRREKKDKNEEDESLKLPKEIPNPDENYVEWLNYSKLKWKIQKQERERREQLFGAKSSIMGRTTLGNMMKKKAESYASATWEILQYKPTSTPGILNVLTLINNKVHTLKFKVPKTIYISFKNSFVPELETSNKCSINKINAMLPNENELDKSITSNVYKVVISERAYEEQSTDPSSIFNNGHVSGIYESHIPSAERTIMDLGCSVEFSSNVKGALGAGLEQGFQISDLRSADYDRYLNSFSMDICYILHMPTTIGYEFFTIWNSWSDVVHVYVLKPSAAAQEISATSVENLYKSQYAKKVKSLDQHRSIVDASPQLIYNFEYHTDLLKLYKKVSKKIEVFKDERGPKILLLLQSPFKSKLLKVLRVLNTLPIVELSITELKVQQLKWHTAISKRLVNHILSLGSWIHNLLLLSRYSGIPICNLKLDNMGYMIDILFSRKLKKENIVLWWNEKQPLPDYGGVEQDYDVSLLSEVKFDPINHPNIYDSVVLEVELNNLTINTILTSSLANEAEGNDLAELGDSIIKDGFNSNSLSILRQLLRQFWDDAIKGAHVADSLLQYFIMWVQNPDSKLFDNSLRYYVQTSANKTLLHVIKEFENLGAFCVYADKSKILLKTPKFTVENSYAYGQYLVKAIRADPIFTYLDLKINKYWDLLIWMDQFNYGGRAATTIQEKEKQDLWAFNEWKIKDFLPKIYKPEFEDWIVIILDSLIKSKETALQESVDGTQRITQLYFKRNMSEKNLENEKENVGTDGGEAGDDSNDFLEGFTNVFYLPMIKRFKKLYDTQQEYILNPAFSADYEFEKLPGTLSRRKSPLLELTIYLCHIMLLSKKRHLEVRKLRKELLKIFEMREFDSEADFVNPAISLVVNNFVCEYCAHEREIDFCRDFQEAILQCGRCGKAYSVNVLQEQLIQKLESQIQCYLLQDLECAKCHKIREDNMSEYCPCSGKWVETVSRSRLTLNLSVFKQIAKHFDFAILGSALEEMGI